jgi:hypothetical protein
LAMSMRTSCSSTTQQWSEWWNFSLTASMVIPLKIYLVKIASDKISVGHFGKFGCGDRWKIFKILRHSFLRFLDSILVRGPIR